ncbi:MAG: PKD domain-containing protein [Flavobacteriales bacterium]|jgi:PKD repeat protein|nr:PKD domain-containing protein [Flavobacteriales bacterium]
MKIFTLTATLFLSLITFTLWGQCNASFNANLDSNGIVTVVNTSNMGATFDFGANTLPIYVPTGNSASFTYTANGLYHICATVVDSNQTPACFDTYCDSIQVTTLGNPCNISSNFNYSISPITQPLSYDFSPVNSTGIVAYSWSFGDGSVGSTSSSPVHTYAQPGTYTVCLIATAANGCLDTTCLSVPVSNNPCNVSAAFNATMSNNDSLSYTFNLIDSISGCNISWDFGDGATGQGDLVTHTFSQAGTYTVCATIWNCTNNCSDTVCQAIIVNGNGNTPCNLNAYFQWYQLYDSLNGSWLNTVYVVNYSSVNSNINYLWDFGDGATSTATYPSHTYNNVGTYTVCVTITETQGGMTCTETHCDTIVVQTKASGFTLNVIAQDAVGIEEEHSSIELGSIYPNPTADNASITIKASENSNLSISIVDLSGKIISQEMVNISAGEHTIQLNTTNLTQGMYFVSISNEDNAKTNLRLIKK